MTTDVTLVLYELVCCECVGVFGMCVLFGICTNAAFTSFWLSGLQLGMSIAKQVNSRGVIKPISFLRLVQHRAIAEYNKLNTMSGVKNLDNSSKKGIFFGFYVLSGRDVSLPSSLLLKHALRISPTSSPAAFVLYAVIACQFALIPIQSQLFWFCPQPLTMLTLLQMIDSKLRIIWDGFKICQR